MNQPSEGFDIGGAGPGRPSGGYTNSEHLGCLMAYGHPTEAERTSSFEGKDKYTVAACEWVLDLTHHKAWGTTDVSGMALVPRLLTAASKVVAVRLILGEAKGDRNPPIIPEDGTAAEIAEVQEVLGKYGARMPTGRIVFDVVQYNADHPEPEPPAAT
jgi:hypothetical protein